MAVGADDLVCSGVSAAAAFIHAGNVLHGFGSKIFYILCGVLDILCDILCGVFHVADNVLSYIFADFPGLLFRAFGNGTKLFFAAVAAQHFPDNADKGNNDADRQ